jgi:hypothetical protein
MPTDEQRENRALLRLQRTPEGLRTGQLHSVGVDNAAIERLANEGRIAPGTLGRWCITQGGSLEMDARFLEARYSTVG